MIGAPVAPALFCCLPPYGVLPRVVGGCSAAELCVSWVFVCLWCLRACISFGCSTCRVVSVLSVFVRTRCRGYGPRNTNGATRGIGCSWTRICEIGSGRYYRYRGYPAPGTTGTTDTADSQPAHDFPAFHSDARRTTPGKHRRTGHRPECGSMHKLVGHHYFSRILPRLLRRS